MPSPPPSRHPAEERFTDQVEPRRAPGDDEDGDAEPPVQLGEVHHVEPGEGDPLEEHELELGEVLRAGEHRRHGGRRVPPVPPDAPGDHPLQPEPGEHRPDDPDVPAVLPREREVVYPHDLGEHPVGRRLNGVS